MYAKVTSLGVTGLAGYIVQVEADLSGGLPQFNLVGLPDSAVKESSERVRSAIKTCTMSGPPAASPSTWPPPTCARPGRCTICRCCGHHGRAGQAARPRQ